MTGELIFRKGNMLVHIIQSNQDNAITQNDMPRPILAPKQENTNMYVATEY